MMIRLIFKNENKIFYNGVMDCKFVMWVGLNYVSLIVWIFIFLYIVYGWVIDWVWYVWCCS